MSEKYPKTMHLPFSPGSTSDDKFMSDEDFEELVGELLVITEKLDGSNVCLTNEHVYARSHAGPPGHASFAPLKKFHANYKYVIPAGFSVFGEWCYAVHSIKYQMLQHPLNLFGVREDETGEWLTWSDVEFFATELCVPTVPVILRGAVHRKEELQNLIENFAQYSSVYGPTREGLVVRKEYDVKEEMRVLSGHNKSIRMLSGLGKWVRKNHVQTDEHWTRKPVERQPTIYSV